MKKMIVLLLLIAGSTQLKAQQIQPAPNLTLNNGFQKNFFKPDSLQKPKSAQPEIVISPKFNIANQRNIVYSTMPVLKISGSTSEHMPVAAPSKNIDHMLVSKVTVVNPLQPAKTEQP